MTNRADVLEFLYNLQVGININDGQPGAGYKTSSFVEYANDNHKKTIGFFSSNHKHIHEVEEGLKKESCLHLKGFIHLCLRYPKTYSRDKWTNDEKLVHDTYKITKKPSQVICPVCEIDNCPYRIQFVKMKGKKILLSPLEFLSRKDVVDIAEEYHFDESIKRIRLCNFGVDYEKLDRFAVDTYIDYGYVTMISKLQKEMLRQTSVLLTQPSDVLMNVTSNHDLYKGMDYENFLRVDKNAAVYLSHYEHLDFLKTLKALSRYDKYLLFDPKEKKKAKDSINRTIRDLMIIGEVFHNYINLSEQLETVEMLKHEMTWSKYAIIVNERIIVMNNWKPNNVVPPDQLLLPGIKAQEIIENTEQYQRGFIGDESYFFNKDKNIYLISKAGKAYDSNENVSFDKKTDSRFTLGFPLMLDVLNHGMNYPINLMDSSFNQTVFDKHKLRFYKNSLMVKRFSGIVIRKIDREPASNKNSIVYNISAPDNQWSCSTGRSSNFSKKYLYPSFEKEGAFKKWIFPKLKSFIRTAKSQGKKVGVITRQDFEKYFVPLVGKKCVNHFYNQRGTNELEGVDVLIVLGTPFHPPKRILFRYVLNFAEKPDNTDVIKDKKSGMFLGYEDSALNDFFEGEVIEEIYQAVHRVRPLLQDKKIILFGMVPDKIREELTVKDTSLEKCIADIFGTKKYYLQHPKIARKKLENAMKGILDSMAYTEFRDAIKGQLVDDASSVWKIGNDDTKLIIYNALDDGMKKIMELLRRWTNKKPLLTNLCMALQKEIGCNRVGTMLAVALLESIGKIEVKEVSLSTIYKKHKRGKGWLLELR